MGFFDIFKKQNAAGHDEVYLEFTKWLDEIIEKNNPIMELYGKF